MTVLIVDLLEAVEVAIDHADGLSLAPGARSASWRAPDVVASLAASLSALNIVVRAAFNASIGFTQTIDHRFAVCQARNSTCALSMFYKRNLLQEVPL